MGLNIVNKLLTAVNYYVLLVKACLSYIRNIILEYLTAVNVNLLNIKLNLFLFFAAFWSSAARLCHTPVASECVAQFVQHEEGQGDTTVFQAVLHQHSQSEASQHCRL